jgi:hypothetical protein
MDLEFLLRRTPAWRQIAEGVLFQTGDIVEHGEDAEAAAFADGDDRRRFSGSGRQPGERVSRVSAPASRRRPELRLVPMGIEAPSRARA